MRLSEPHILFTDGILGVLAILYAFFLIRIDYPKKKSKTHVAWIGYWISMGFSALTGAIKHFTIKDTIYNLTSKLDMIWDGLAMFCAQLAIPWSFCNEQSQNIIGYWINATASLILFMIFLILWNWNFSTFEYYFLLVALQFVTFIWIMPKNNRNSYFDYIARELAIFFVIVLVLGIVYLIGRNRWDVYYGSENQYLLQISNEIFHLGMLYPNFRLFKAICNILKPIPHSIP